MPHFSKKIISSTWFILTILMLLMLYFRIVPIHGIVFTNWPWFHGNYVNFAPDDAVYHMRLVHNTLQHFPQRIFFDPFTHIPYGNQIHFGPFFTLMIASLAWFLGLGHPSVTLTNAVGAYFPPILGALCLIPTYFIGKKMFGKSAGLFAAAFLAFMSGEFFYRSVLGFTDQHVAETLFSTFILMFLVYAFSETKLNRKVIWYASGAGVAFGVYFLTWLPALLIAELLFVFFIIQLLRNYYRTTSNNVLMAIVTLVYIIPTLIILPYALLNPQLQFMYYSLAQPLIMVGLGLTLWLFYGWMKILGKFSLNRWWSWGGLIILFGIIFLGIKFFLPQLFIVILTYFKLLLVPSPGLRTIAENWPAILDRETSELTYTTLWYNFFFALPLAVIAAVKLIEKNLRINQSRDLLLLVWSIGMLYAMFELQRFGYYLAVNVAVLAGYAGAEFFTYWKQKFSALITTAPYYAVKFSIFILGFIGLFLLIIYPRSSLTETSHNYSSFLPRAMYDVYQWLHQHTPDPQGERSSADFDYQRGFYPIPRAPYRYPASAYGILAWWSVGHQLTYVAERIPNANPFQDGIVEKDPRIGVAPFFTSTSETEALYNLNVMRTRYILIDNYTANNQYLAMLLWQNLPTNNWIHLSLLTWHVKGEKRQFQLEEENQVYYDSMLYRLYFLDGNNLQHLRLIYESPGDYLVNFRTLDVKTGAVRNNFCRNGKTLEIMQRMAQEGIEPHWADFSQNTIIYGAKPPVKEIKIFEKVAGAIIRGTAPLGTTVTLQINLLTNVGRTFAYTQTIRADVHGYQFIVPYATTAMQGKNYSSGVKALTPYIIQFADQRYVTVKVSEDAVQNGTVIEAGREE